MCIASTLASTLVSGFQLTFPMRPLKYTFFFALAKPKAKLLKHQIDIINAT